MQQVTWILSPMHPNRSVLSVVKIARFRPAAGEFVFFKCGILICHIGAGYIHLQIFLTMGRQ